MSDIAEADVYEARILIDICLFFSKFKHSYSCSSDVRKQYKSDRSEATCITGNNGTSLNKCDI